MTDVRYQGSEPAILILMSKRSLRLEGWKVRECR